MSDFVIIADSSSDFTKELREQFDIPELLMGMVYFPDGHSEYADVDWERHSPEKFYESMRDRQNDYKSAYAPIGDIMKVYEKYLQQGKDIICITLSSALSGTYQVCQKVANELLEKYPERKIVCVDSLRYSYAAAQLIIMAATKRDEGCSFDETVEYLEKNKHRVHQMGSMDDLFFLCKAGRISNFKAIFGTMLGINVMADFSRTGFSEVVGKIKGKKLAIESIINYMKHTIIDPEKQIIFVAHSNRQAAAELLRDMIIKEFNPKEVRIVPLGMGSGVSVGPGLCAAYYCGEEISEDMAREKEIMEKFLQK